MKKRSVFWTVVTMAWAWLSILVSEKLFPSDHVAEITLLICFASLAIFISFSTEYFISRLKVQRKD